jgi:hypothetical protein
MNEVFDIQSEYLDALNDYNKTVIEIEKNTWQ